MKATELLREQHREIERLFQRVQATEDVAEKTAAFRELAAIMAGHTAIETEIFYPAAMEAQVMTEDVREANEEHAAIDFTLYRLFQVQPDDETFQARVMVLEELFTRHLEDREEALLSQVETSMNDKRLEDLGEQLKARMAVLQRRGNVQTVLAQRIGAQIEIARRPARRAAAVQEKPARRAPVKAKQAAARKEPAKRAARAPSRPQRGAAVTKTTRSRKAARSSR
jgi:hypothetical protein